jgi:hypothetical protein
MVMPWLGFKPVAIVFNLATTMHTSNYQLLGLQAWQYEFKVVLCQSDLMYEHWKSWGICVGLFVYSLFNDCQ